MRKKKEKKKRGDFAKQKIRMLLIKAEFAGTKNHGSWDS